MLGNKWGKKAIVELVLGKVRGVSTIEYILSTLFIGIALFPIIKVLANGFIDYFEVLALMLSAPF